MDARKYCDDEASEKERSAIHWHRTVVDQFNYNMRLTLRKRWIA